MGVAARASPRDRPPAGTWSTARSRSTKTLVGGVKPGIRGRGADDKALVVIAVERRDGGPGRIRMRPIPNAAVDTLTDLVLDHVPCGAEVNTDGWSAYNDVGCFRFTHVVTNISACGDPVQVAMAKVHRVASLLNRWLHGTHQGAVSHDHLGYYPDEFTFRFPRRRSHHRGLLFYRHLEGAVATDPHRYRGPGRITKPRLESGERCRWPQPPAPMAR